MLLLFFQPGLIALVASLSFMSCRKGNIPAYGNETVATDSVLYRAVLGGGEHGEFAKGDVSIEKLSGVKYLVFKNFSSSNGPALHVYLSATPGNRDNPPTQFVDLGLLKYTGGAFNYELKGNPVIENYKYVIIWCARFNVQFGIAELKK